MANRISNLNTFANLSPPWLLSSLDQNSNFITTGFNDSSLGFGNGIPTDTGTANNYIIALPYGSPSAYNPGMLVGFTPSNTNTGASTLTVTPLGVVSILNAAGLALSGGEINQNQTLWMMYSSVSPIGFRIISPCGFYRNLSGQSSNQLLNVAGYSSVSIVIAWSSGTSLSTVLTNVSSGIPVSITLVNQTVANTGFGIGFTNSSGATMTVQGLQSGSATGIGFLNMGSGIVIGANAAMCFTGVTGVSVVTLSH